MPTGPEQIMTARLVLRRWRPADAEALAAINADPLVMRHFPSPLTHAETVAQIERFEQGFRRHGFGSWALDLRYTGSFIGFTGLTPAPPDVPSAAVANEPSLAVMRRLGMTEWLRFDHPRIEESSPVRPHVAYRIDAGAWAHRSAPLAGHPR